MGRNKNLLMVLDPRGQPSGIFGRSPKLKSHPGDILDPDAQPSGGVEQGSMAPRLDTLDGKTVYLVNTGFAGSQEFLEEVSGWFSEHRPSVKTVMRKKQGTIFTDDPDLWAEIREKASAVIFGVGG